MTFPITIKNSYTATNCDELHAFQSTCLARDNNGNCINSKIVGDMHVIVGDKLQEIYNNKINPKVTKVSVKVQGMVVTWYAVIDQSDDGNAWVGFTSRGAGCDNDIINRAESVSVGNDVGTLTNRILEVYKESSIDIEIVNDFVYNGGSNSFRQVFYRYTKPISNPPHSSQISVNSQSQPQTVFDERLKATGSVAKAKNGWKFTVYTSTDNKIVIITNTNGDRVDPIYYYSLKEKDEDILYSTLDKVNGKTPSKAQPLNTEPETDFNRWDNN